MPIDLMDEQDKRESRSVPFALAECLLNKIRDSDATEEEAGRL